MENLDLEAIDYAVHKTVISHRGSSKSVAPDMGMGQIVFLAKANANRSDTHFSPSELLHLMALTNDYRALYEMANQLGFTLVKRDAAADTSVFAAFIHNAKEQGDVALAIETALEDGRITRDESQNIHARINGARQALDTLESAVDKSAE